MPGKIYFDFPGSPVINKFLNFQACLINYDFITHLDHSNDEIPYLLKEMQIQNLTKVPGKYSWSPVSKDELNWQTVPRGIAIDIYRHYFIDFGEPYYHGLEITVL